MPLYNLLVFSQRINLSDDLLTVEMGVPFFGAWIAAPGFRHMICLT